MGLEPQTVEQYAAARVWQGAHFPQTSAVPPQVKVSVKKTVDLLRHSHLFTGTSCLSRKCHKAASSKRSTATLV